MEQILTFEIDDFFAIVNDGRSRSFGGFQRLVRVFPC